MTSPRLCALAFLCIFFFSDLPANAGTRQKKDVIYMKNGDRITCEIKKLEYQQLEVKAPYGKGSFIINWGEIEKIESPQPFVVEAQAGTYFEGLIHADAKEGDNIDVLTGTEVVSLPQKEVIGVRQYGRETLDRIKFAIDYGFTYARSNEQTQSTLHSNLDYNSADVYTGGSIDSLFAGRSDASNTNRHEGQAFFYRRIQGSRWYGGAFGNFLTNNQQDLTLRISGGGGVLRNVFTTNKNSLTAQAGLVYSHESYSVPDPDGSQYNNAEAALGVRFSTFRFDSTEFIANWMVYPSLNRAGRVRSALNVSLYFKIIGDFYTRFGAYSNFDSQPPNNTAKNDYGLTSSIGWSF